jgi:hypothetical protein
MAEATFTIESEWLKKKFKCPECGSDNVKLRTKPDGWLSLIFVNEKGFFVTHEAELGEPEPDQVADGGRCLNPNCLHDWDEPDNIKF